MGWAASAFISAFTLLFGWVFNLIALISAGLLQGVSQIFNWVISENFISLSYTDPARNPFIAVGWDLTRGLANIFFVLALVAIGLGTALRMQDYQAKKKLPMLIIMALLINFTPVILGLIVDGSNLIMNFFLQGVTGTDVFTSNIITIGNNFKGSATIWDPQMAMSSTINSITISIFNFITMFILFLFCVLFIMRYVMIWVLVILSPLAFASYVFPQTRREFSEWWKNFIQWVTVGVTGTFFLYLGSQIMYLSGTESFKNQLSSIPGGGGAADFSMLFNSLLPYGIAMVVMSIGLTKSLSSGNAASSWAVGFAKGLPARVAGMKPVGQRLAKASRWSAGLLNKTANRMGQFENKIGKVPILGGAMKSLNIGPKVGLQYAAGYLNKSAEKWSKINIEEALKKQGITDIVGMSDYFNRSGVTELEQLQGFSYMAEKGFLQKTPQNFDRAASLAQKYALDPHTKKFASDIADTIPNYIDAKTKIDLEAVKEDRDKMNDKINKLIEEEITNSPDGGASLQDHINEETVRLTRIKGDTSIDNVRRNVAAQQIHMRTRKSGDVKDFAKTTIKSEAFARAQRETTPNHSQAVFENFDPETANAYFEKTFSNMFKGKTEQQCREYLEKWASDPKHARIFQWALKSPIGIQMNLKLKDYMTDQYDQPTTRVDSFEKRLRVQEFIKGKSNLEKMHSLIKDLEKLRVELRAAKDTATKKMAQDGISDFEDQMTSLKNDIRKNYPNDMSEITRLESLMKKGGDGSGRKK